MSVRSIIGVGGAALLGACSLLTDFGSLTNGDGGSSDSGPDVVVPAQGFDLLLSPAHLTADPGDPQVDVTITVVRATSFTDRVVFSPIKGGVPNVTATTPPDVQPGSTTTTFIVSVDKNAMADQIEHDLVVSATSGDGKFTKTVNLGLFLGSVLAPNDAGVITVPGFAPTLAVEMKAWGAGGGGGTGANGGGVGGSGGFTIARFSLPQGTALVASEATGGGAGSNGGGGGGYSSVRDLDGGAYWIIAPGGGGGGGDPNAKGGVGGGANGGTGGSSCPGQGATPTVGGLGATCGTHIASSGTNYVGGDAYNSWKGSGGKPGGGNGSFSGGAGGGAGYYGGGGSANYSGMYGGAGGGSGYAREGGTNVMLVSGGANGAAPALSDPDHLDTVAVGGAAGNSNAMMPSAPGGPGRVVVRLAKP